MSSLAYARQYVHHRAKAFAGFLAASMTGAIITALERTFDFELGPETEAFLIGLVTSHLVYWTENGPRERSA